MRYVKVNHAVEVIRRLFPGAANITVSQVYKDRGGWRDLKGISASGNGFPIRDLPRLRDEGNTAVQLRLIDQYGVVRFPDYQMSEFEEEFKWEPMDKLEVNVNQGDRDAYILAVIGDEALLEYEMPSGTTALWVIPAGEPRPGCIRNVSYKRCPQKWLRAMEEAGTQWEGNGQ